MSQSSKRSSQAWADAKSEILKIKLEAILQESDILFARKGYASTSLEDVAGQLNITKTALYHYVKNKNELLYLCYQRSLERTEKYYDQAEREGTTGLEKLCRYLRLDAEGGVISMTPLTELHAIKDSESRRELAERLRVCEQRFRGFIEEGVEDGGIAPCDAEQTTRFILGASRNMLQWYEPDAGHNLVAIVEQFLDFCLNGLLPR